MPKLVITAGDMQGKTFELGEGTYTLGRGAENSLQIPDDSVSYHHGEVVVAGGRVFIRDLDSTNGTAVNKNPVAPAENGSGIEVQGGDEVLFGHVPTRFELSVPTPVVAPVSVPQPPAAVAPPPASAPALPVAPNQQIVLPSAGGGLQPLPVSPPLFDPAPVAPESLLGRSQQPMVEPKPVQPVQPQSELVAPVSPIPAAPVAIPAAPVPIPAAPVAIPAVPVPIPSVPVAMAPISTPPSVASPTPAATEFSPRLVVYGGPLKGKTFDLKEGRHTIGRLDDNTIFIPDDSISSHHAELVILAGHYSFRDLDSTNGTRVNQGKVEPYSPEKNNATALKNGDQILLGDVLVRLELTLLPPPPAELTTPPVPARLPPPPAGNYPTPTRVRADQIGIAQSLSPDKVSTGFQKKVQTQGKVSPIVYIIGVAAILLGIGLWFIFKHAAH